MGIGSLKDRVNANREIGKTHGDKISLNPKGRPKKDENQLLTKKIPVGFTENEFEELEKKATQLGLSASAYIGGLVRKDLLCDTKA